MHRLAQPPEPLNRPLPAQFRDADILVAVALAGLEFDDVVRGAEAGIFSKDEPGGDTQDEVARRRLELTRLQRRDPCGRRGRAVARAGKIVECVAEGDRHRLMHEGEKADPGIVAERGVDAVDEGVDVVIPIRRNDIRA
jgi:hypothetical protein